MTHNHFIKPQQTVAQGPVSYKAPCRRPAHYVKLCELRSSPHVEDIHVEDIGHVYEPEHDTVRPTSPVDLVYSPESSITSQRSDSDSEGVSDSSSQTSNGDDSQECSRVRSRERDFAPPPQPLSEALSTASIDPSSGDDAAQQLPRRRSRVTTGSQPCQLKRDTELTDCFVTLLILFATRLVTAIWPLSACKPRTSTCFNGAGVLPLRVFIQETLRRSKTSYSTLQVALFYLILLKDKLPQGDFTREQPSEPRCKILQCGRRMFLSALMLASKYLQDRNYSTRAWSKISGLKNTEINENETTYLQEIDYKLHLPKESFDNWNKIVLALSKLADRQPFTTTAPLSPKFGPLGCFRDMRDVPLLRYCSEDWWQSLIKDLAPEVVKDTTATEIFLVTKLPKNIVLDVLSPPDEGIGRLPSPADQASDLMQELAMRNTLNGSLTRGLEPVVMTNGDSIPTRPCLPNLPTPVGTPQVDSPLGVNCVPKPTLRCAASMSALSGLKKQGALNANLERCPPPQRPQSMVLPSTFTSSCRSSTPLSSVFSSPASMVSDTATFNTRSRSSSISSTTSWSAVPPRNMHQAQTPVDLEYSSPLSRVSSTTSEPAPVRLPKTIRRVDNFPMPSRGAVISRSSIGLPYRPPRLYGKQPATTGSWSDTIGTGEESLEAEAAKALMSLHSSPLRQCTTTANPQARSNRFHDRPAICGHKRALSGSKDQPDDMISVQKDRLQERVASLVHQTGRGPGLAQDAVRSARCKTEDKQWQVPNASWASVKQPISNACDSKRLALLQDEATGHADAPTLAAWRLRSDIKPSACERLRKETRRCKEERLCKEVDDAVLEAEAAVRALMSETVDE